MEILGRTSKMRNKQNAWNQSVTTQSKAGTDSVSIAQICKKNKYMERVFTFKKTQGL